MITETFNKQEIAQYIGKHGVERKLEARVFGSHRVKEIQRKIKDYWRKSRSWPFIFKEPIKVTIDGNEYFCILSIAGERQPVDFNTYLRIFDGKRKYVYYTIPVGLGIRPDKICTRFSAHFQERFQDRCPKDESQHFLVQYLKDQKDLSFIVPAEVEPGLEIWKTTKTGVILMIDWTYISYYRKLSEFSEDRQNSYQKYWEEHGRFFGEPSLQELLQKLEENEEIQRS